MEQKIDPKDARQGRKGTPVLKVLIGALVLAAIAWFAVGMFGETTDPQAPAIEESDAPTPSTDETLDPATETPTVEPQTAPQ